MRDTVRGTVRRGLLSTVDGRLLTAVALLAFPLATRARAAGAKYQKQEVEVQATQTDLTRAETPEQAQAVAKKPKAPALHAEEFTGVNAQKTAALNADEIEKYQMLLDGMEDSDPEKPKIMFDLAEVKFQQERYYETQARLLDDPIFKERDPAKKARLQQKQKNFESQEHEWLLQAVKQYKDLADNTAFANYKEMDKVLFYLGFTLEQVGKEDFARTYYGRLIKDYPTSPYLPSAWLSFGEYWFQQGDMDKALKSFDNVLKYRDSDVYGFALYQEAWCYYNMGQKDVSLKTFVQVIDFATHGANTEKNKDLARTARHELVMPYSQVGTPEKAYPFFQKVGGDQALTMLGDLADAYSGEGRFDDAITVYRELLSLQPNDPHICEWQSDIVRNTISLYGSNNSTRSKVITELQRLGATYARLKGLPGVKPDVLEDCTTDTQQSLRELATTWHKEGQQTKNHETYKLAAYLYKEYIDRFPDADDHYQMNYWYSDLKWQIATDETDQRAQEQAWLDVADAFDAVAAEPPKGNCTMKGQTKPCGPNWNFVKDAAYAAVLATKNALDIDDSINAASRDMQHIDIQKAEKQAGQVQAVDITPQPIPENQAKLLARFDRYLGVVKDVDATERLTIEYRKSHTYWQYKHYKEAEPGFKDICFNHSDSDLAVYSCNLLLSILDDEKRYDEFADDTEQMLKDAKLTGAPAGTADPCAAGVQLSELGAQLCEFQQHIDRIKTQELEAKGKWKECGVAYRKLAMKYPNDPKLDEVFYNAAVCFAKAHLIGQAVFSFNALITQAPKSPLAQKALYDIGVDYQTLAFYREAADTYEKFASQFGGEKEAPAALQNATVFRTGLGDDDQAVKDSNLYITNATQHWHKADQAAEVFFSLGQIVERRETDPDKSAKHYAQYLRDWATKGGVDRAVEAHIKIAEILWRESCPVGDGVNFACIKVERVRSGGRVGKTKVSTQCGPATKSKITVFERKQAEAAEAIQHFKAALKLAQGKTVQSVPGDTPDEKDARFNLMMRDAAEAAFFLEEADYEKYLNMPFPQNLDFNPDHKKEAEASKKVFLKWLSDKEALADKLKTNYEKVITTGVAAWAIASAARIGELFENYADALYTAPVPPIPPKYKGAIDPEDWRDNFCDALADKAGPPETNAETLFTKCLDESTKLSWYSRWSQECEGELNQMDPSKFPLAAELRASPGYVSEHKDMGSAILEIAQ